MSSISVSGYELEWCNLFVKFFCSILCYAWWCPFTSNSSLQVPCVGLVGVNLLENICGFLVNL
jgi:hypothetical protein